MSATAIYDPPVNDHLFALEERIHFYQEVALRLLAAQDWWRAFRAMARVETLSRRLPPSPMAAIKTALFGPAAPEPPPAADLAGNTAEQNHAIYVELLRRLRAKAAERGEPDITDAEMFAWFSQQHGHQVAAGVGRIMAQRAAPSG